jgi:hypothetical protein
MLANTDEHQLVPSLSSGASLGDLRPYVKVKVQSQNRSSWTIADVANNDIEMRGTGIKPKYLEDFIVKLSQKRLVTHFEDVAVGALGFFCVPLSNESPSWTRWTDISLSLTCRSVTISKSQIPRTWLPPTTGPK